MDKQDTRWEQRFSNFKKALAKLSETVYFVKDNYFVEGSLMNRASAVPRKSLLKD